MQCSVCNTTIRYDSKTGLCTKHLPGSEPKKLVAEDTKLILESDWSDLVVQVYGRPYQFQQQGEMKGQNTIYEFTVPESFDNWDISGVDAEIQEWLNATPPREEIGEGDSSITEFRVTLWWLRENYPDFETIMIDLARRGLIDPGSYALHTCW